MLDPIWLKAVAKVLILPPGGPLLIAVAGLALWSRRPRAGRVVTAFGVLLLFVLSLPVVAGLLLRGLDSSPPLDLTKAKTAQAIVILGGGTRRNAAEYGGDTLAQLTLERVRYGARVARATGLPVLVTGGSVHGGIPEALLMRNALTNEFAVAVRWVEGASRTTRENAAMTARILRADHVDRVVLVAHSFDIPRATAELAEEGIATIPAPTGIVADHELGLFDFLPSMAGMQGSYYALYEILANFVRLSTPSR